MLHSSKFTVSLAIIAMTLSISHGERPNIKVAYTVENNSDQRPSGEYQWRPNFSVYSIDRECYETIDRECYEHIHSKIADDAQEGWERIFRIELISDETSTETWSFRRYLRRKKAN